MEGTRLHINHVCPAGYPATEFIPAVPYHLMGADSHLPGQQCPHFLSREAVDHNLHVACLGDVISNRCLRVKGIGDVRVEREPYLLL